MPSFGNLARKFSTASRILRTEGIGGVTAEVWGQVDLRISLLAARKQESVTLDGCTFSLKQIPNSRMKLALVQKTYEKFERRATLQYVDRDKPVVELGGCIGVVACITNRILKNPKAHVVVEANPVVVPLLEESRRNNQCDFEILGAAIAYGVSSIPFSPSKDLWASSLHVQNAGTPVNVPATRLGDILSERKFDAYTLICDIEGYEYDLVLNEADVVQKAETLILETHPLIIGEAKTDHMMKRLDELGFRIIDRESSVVVMKRSPAPQP